MKKVNFIDYFHTLNRAINRLKEVVEASQVQQNEYAQDAAIQRFEFTIELFWKLLKRILFYEKIDSTTPRDTISKAYQYKLIDFEDVWLKMLDDRNNTSHAYKEEMAKLIFQRIKTYVPIFEKSYMALKNKYRIQ